MGEDKGKSPSTYDHSVKEIRFFDKKLVFKQPKFHRISVDLVIFISKLKGIKRSSKVIDLGAGFGFLSITVAKLYGCRVYAVERDPLLYSLLEYNINVNSLANKIVPIKGDIKNVDSLVGRSSFDICLINPPFYHGPSSNIARTEDDTKLHHFIKASSYAIRDGGYVNIFFIPNRLYELFIELNKNNIHPFYLSLLYPKMGKRPKRVIVSSRKNIKGLLEFDEPFFINTDKSYTYQTIETLKGLSSKL